MDYFIKKRFSFWLVFFLLVVNVATITTILYHIYSDKTTASPATVNNGVGKIITTELELNAQQKDMFSSINDVYNGKSKAVLDQLTDKRSEMLAELGEENPDTLILNTIANDIGELHAVLKLLTIENFLELKKICTPDQQQQLSKMYNDMLECEGHFKGYGKQYRHRYRHGQGEGKGWQKKN
jgi:Spy/CpxP family protein refolding chaperone